MGRVLDFCFTPKRLVSVAPSGREAGLMGPSMNPVYILLRVAMSPDDLLISSMPSLHMPATLLSSSQEIDAGLTFLEKELDSGRVTIRPKPVARSSTKLVSP